MHKFISCPKINQYYFDVIHNLFIDYELYTSKDILMVFKFSKNIIPTSRIKFKKYSKLLLFFKCFYIFSTSLCSQENSSFIHIDKKFNAILSIEADSLGFMYFFDRKGFHKYDGYDYSFTSLSSIFTHNSLNNRRLLVSSDPKKHFWFANQNGNIATFNPYTSRKNVIYRREKDKKIQFAAMYADTSNLWLGSKRGILYKLDKKKQHLDSLTSLPTIRTIVQTIRSITIPSSDQLWMSTNKGKIYSYNIQQNELTELILPFKNNIFQEIRITYDNRGWLWIATELNGLYSYDIKSKSFDRYDSLLESFSPFRNPMFICIFVDSKGIVWAGTDGDGLFRIDPIKRRSTISTYSKANKFSIGNNTIMDISEDAKKNLWLTLKGGKIDVLIANTNQINYTNGSQSQEPVPVLSMLKSSDGSLWIGTDGEGLNRTLQGSTNIQYNEHAIVNNYFIGRYIQGLVEDNAKNIWIATYQNGLWVYDSDQNKFKKINTTDSFNRYSPDIRTLFKDSKDRIWASSGAAIQIFSSKMDLLAAFDYDSHGLNGNLSQAITEDKNNQIWIGLNNGGLFEFMENENNLSFSHFNKHIYYHADKSHNYNYNITGLQSDFNNNLWITNDSGFITKFNTTSKKFESYLGKNQLQDIHVRSLLVEDKNNIWISSDEGLHQFNIQNNELKSYFQADGLRDSDFFKRSAHKDQTGIFYFGGKNGVNSFLPQIMKQKDNNAKLRISSLEILNKPADSIIPTQLVDGINNLKSISLKAGQSSFSLQFVAIDNILNPNYYYAYKLHGFDENWIEAKKDRMATYTNIPFGKYIFEVKAGTRKDIWDIPSKTIDFVIKPHWWRSTLAYFAYFLIAGLLILGILFWVRMRNKLLQEEWEHSKESEIYVHKMNFFAKMSHEIKTPLTLILGPIDDMLQRAGKEGNLLLKQRLSLIKNNAKRLSRISTELMTVRNKELNKLRIYASKTNIVGDIKQIAESFEEQARFKNIDFIKHYEESEVQIWYDIEKIEHVFYNLLSNAFKFTPNGGQINIKVTLPKDKESVEISVTDSGPGISEHELKDIFELYYQSGVGKQLKGMGIGLALCKELIDLHHGQIEVSSTENGTNFTVFLSTKDTIFKDQEKHLVIDDKKVIPDNFTEEQDILNSGEILSKKTHTVLVVEDNVDMQIFLRDLLKEKYIILIAENGKQGYMLAKENRPDLIISDVMMPILDGFEMSKKLKKNKITAHIPIILLTARNTENSKLLGLKSGAAVYIQKPFNSYELLLNIQNVIKDKEKTIKQYKTQKILDPEINNIQSKDDEFIEKMASELNAQIENSDFKLEELSNTMNMSYSSIFRKCQEIIGKTPLEIQRTLKLKKAAILILQHGFPIAEAGYKVGYNDAKYFTKCFKEEFGKPPLTLKKETDKKGWKKTFKKYKI